MSYGVAIAAFDAQETLAETLESLLAQTVPPAQIVVVDDGSRDRTAAVAERFGPAVTLLRQRNRGLARASSRAVRACTHPIVAMVDADDLWLPHKMEMQLPRIRSLGTDGIVYSHYRTFRHGDPRRVRGAERTGIIRSTTVFHRTLFDRTGDFFVTSDNVGDMVDWLARARERGARMEPVEAVLMLRRIIETSLTYGRNHRGYLMAARAALLRKRARDDT